MKVTTKTMMLRALAAALLAACTLPALAQDRERLRERQGEGQEQEREDREERRRERQERADQAAGEAAQQSAAQQEAARVEQQRVREPERRGYDQEAQRAEAYERARQPVEQPQVQQRERAVDRQGANERQQQAIDLRAQQMREAEARRVQQERQERYGYGNTRDGGRDQDDGDRRRGNDRNDRDGRYSGGGRDRDGDRNDRNDRDGRHDGDRDGRWDDNSQRRWDNWQRDADRYRREATRRHDANRYASLREQQRMRQYRYQQDYWERQRRWHSGWNTRRYDRNFVIAPIVYRYSRGGRWYDINRYAADTLQEAIRIGYAEGARAGDADRYDGWRGGYRDNFVYQDADFGYDGYYVSLPEYQYYFREGFRRGYEDAYGSRYRYGRRNGNDFVIAAATLGLILNLQDY